MARTPGTSEAVRAVGCVAVWLLPVCGPLVFPPAAGARGLFCSGAATSAPGDVFAVEEETVYRVAPDTSDVACVAGLAGLVAVSGSRDGTLFAISTNGTTLYHIDATNEDPPYEIALTPPLDSPVDIAVAESGLVAVLEANGGDGKPAISVIDPLTGVVARLSPPEVGDPPGPIPPTNHLGNGGSVASSIAVVPGGDLLVAQAGTGTFQIVRVAPDGTQSLFSFAVGSLAAPGKLAIDALTPQRAILVSDTGDVVSYHFGSGAARHLGSVNAGSSNIDVTAAGGRHAFVASGGLYEVRWRPGPADWFVRNIPGFTGSIVSLSAYRGPVAPGGVLATHTFEEPVVFEETFFVNTNGSTGTADLSNIGSNGVLALTVETLQTASQAPVSVLTEIPVPLNAIRFECDYRFGHPRARMNVYVNQRRAFTIAPPPLGQDGGVSTESFAHLAREINLDKLGLLGAPRLLIELRLVPPTNTDMTPETVQAFVDNLILRSSMCGQIFGDLNGDTFRDLCDVQYLTEHYGEADDCNDLNQDGYVDAFDFANLMQLIDREYLGDCPQPDGKRSLVPEDATSPLTEGNLIVVAKDYNWEDWIYEVRLDPPECVRKFRTPDSGEFPPVYTQVRADGHGAVYAVDFNGYVERWENSASALVHTPVDLVIPQPPPVPIDGLTPVDVAITRGNGIWVNYAPTARTQELPELSYLLHFADDGTWIDAYTNDSYTRGRTLLTGNNGEVWSVTADRINFSEDLLTNLVLEPAEIHAINGVAATVCTDLTRDQAYLRVGSAEDDAVATYDVWGGMAGVSEGPVSTVGLSQCTAVTGTAEDAASGDVYACGFQTLGVPIPWHMEPRLALVAAGNGDPGPIVVDCGSYDLHMPISVVLYRVAEKGDFDADGDLDLYDFGRFQHCLDKTEPYCLDDFDFDEDSHVTLADYTLLEAVLTGPNPSGPGDFDGDGDVDLDDLAVLTACLAGPVESTPPGDCTQEQFEAVDVDEDNDVDLGDFTAFQIMFAG